MPTGFGEVPITDSTEGAVRLGGGTLSSAAVPFPTVGVVYHRYQQGTNEVIGGPYVASTAILLQNPKDAPKLMQAWRDAAASSPTWDQPRTDPRPGTDSYTSTALSFPKIGDDLLAVRLTAKFRDAEFGFESAPSTADYIVWRHGPFVNVVLASNTDTLTQVKKADAKVVKALVACPKETKKKKHGTRATTTT